MQKKIGFSQICKRKLQIMQKKVQFRITQKMHIFQHAHSPPLMVSMLLMVTNDKFLQTYGSKTRFAIPKMCKMRYCYSAGMQIVQEKAKPCRWNLPHSWMTTVHKTNEECHNAVWAKGPVQVTRRDRAGIRVRAFPRGDPEVWTTLGPLYGASVTSHGRNGCIELKAGRGLCAIPASSSPAGGGRRQTGEGDGSVGRPGGGARPSAVP